MISRKTYREALKNHQKILTDQEFNQLSINEQFNYALHQKRFDLPVTVEQDTYYEHQAGKNSYEPIKIKTRGKFISLMGLLSLIDLIYSYCKIGK